MELLICYLLGINLIAFLLFAVDKWKAVQHRFRIRESVLLGAAAAGGAFGGLLAMRLFRHKTKKPRFAWGIPAMFAFHIVILLYAGRILGVLAV
ncbi:MAG: DUF1294 domain-containing protein [Lachnospiraceae bacterium]|nr:DUF1294 domain-containing protein [Lachnospiraceae bacterium]